MSKKQTSAISRVRSKMRTALSVFVLLLGSLSFTGCPMTLLQNQETGDNSNILTWLLLAGFLNPGVYEEPLLPYTLEECSSGSPDFPPGFSAVIGGYDTGGFNSALGITEASFPGGINDLSLIQPMRGIQITETLDDSIPIYDEAQLEQFLNDFLMNPAWTDFQYCDNLNYSSLGRLSYHRAVLSGNYHARQIRDRVDTVYGTLIGALPLEKVKIAVLPDWFLKVRISGFLPENIHLIANNAFYSGATDSIGWGENMILIAPFTADFLPLVGNVHFYENNGVIYHEYGHHVLATLAGDKTPPNFIYSGFVNDRRRGSTTGLDVGIVKKMERQAAKALTAISLPPVFDTGFQDAGVSGQTFGVIHEAFGDLLAYFAMGNDSRPLSDAIGSTRAPDDLLFESGAGKALPRSCMVLYAHSARSVWYGSENYNCPAAELSAFGGDFWNGIDIHNYGAVVAAAVAETYELFTAGANYTDNNPRLVSGEETAKLLAGAQSYFNALPAANPEFYQTVFYAYAVAFGLEGMNTDGKAAVCQIITDRFPFLMTPEGIGNADDLSREQYVVYNLLDGGSGTLGQLDCFDKTLITQETTAAVGY